MFIHRERQESYTSFSAFMGTPQLHLSAHIAGPLRKVGFNTCHTLQIQRVKNLNSVSKNRRISVVLAFDFILYMVEVSRISAMA